MNKKNKILIIFLLISLLCFSQKNITINYVDSGIQDLIKIAQIKDLNTVVPIYSIQLKASENPEKITAIKNKYTSLFPNEIIDEIFEPPYFKAITGIYSDKNQAEKKLKEVQKKFKSSFVLKREIPIKRFQESRTQ